MEQTNKNEQDEIRNVAMQVLQSELNNANARIVQITTELLMVRKELEEYKEPKEKPEEG